MNEGAAAACCADPLRARYNARVAAALFGE